MNALFRQGQLGYPPLEEGASDPSRPPAETQRRPRLGSDGDRAGRIRRTAGRALRRRGQHREVFAHPEYSYGYYIPPLIAALVVLLATAAASLALPNRAEVIPERTNIDRFPVTLGEWEGTPDHLEPNILRILRADDTLVIDNTHPSGFLGQLYAAFYGSQRRGTSTHSPRECIPGGGWELGRLVRHRIDDPAGHPCPLGIHARCA